MGARSWSSSAPSVPSSHQSTTTTTTTATATTAANGSFFSCSSSSLSSSPCSSPPSSCSPSPTGGKKHHRYNNHLQQQQQQQQQLPKQTASRNDRHAFFRIPVAGGGTKKLLDVTPESVATAKAAVAAAAQRAERNLSVRRDLVLDLPTCPTLPDGEEKPYGSSTRLRIRDHDQESEIYQECIRPPPNRTVHETSTSFPPFRCNSESILTERPSAACGRTGNSKTAGPSTNSQSSSSSIMAVYCCTSASYSSSTSSLSSASYGSPGYRNLIARPNNQQQPQQQQQQQQQQQHCDNKDIFTTPAMATRLLLDIHGQPIVTRSKSMSTGSSLQQPDGSPCPAGSSSCNTLAVMVPFPPPPLPCQQQPCSTGPASSSKSLESAVKSCVRSFRDRVVYPSAKLSSATVAISCSSHTGAATTRAASGGGVDNAGFVEGSSCGRWPSAALVEQQQQQQNSNNNNNYSQATEEPSSGSSRSKLANLPVVPCASASTSYSSSSSSSSSSCSNTSSQTRRDL